MLQQADELQAFCSALTHEVRDGGGNMAQLVYKSVFHKYKPEKPQKGRGEVKAGIEGCRRMDESEKERVLSSHVLILAHLMHGCNKRDSATTLHAFPHLDTSLT